MQIMHTIVLLFLKYGLDVCLYQFYSSMHVDIAILYLVATVNSCLATVAMKTIFPGIPIY